MAKLGSDIFPQIHNTMARATSDNLEPASIRNVFGVQSSLEQIASGFSYTGPEDSPTPG